MDRAGVDGLNGGRVLDRMDRDIARLEAELNVHARQAGHTGEPDYRAGVQRQFSDLTARIARMEVGVASTLVGVVVLLLKAFLPYGS
jgi:hypothetical protein